MLLPKTPHLLGRLARAFSDSMLGLLTTEKVSATAYVGIDGFVDPCKFGANLVD